mmetsp:Transcript_31988/g.70005  ORF Transcript_31988/g.70005 Transcript_31988/m.70005 type:complete len:221 (+) Transcript_31988:1504-2166(+)
MREAKVSELDVPAERDEHVARLQVPMDDSASMQVLQSQQDLRAVLLRPALWKEAEAFERGLQVAAGHVLHHQEEQVARLKAVIQIDEHVVAASLRAAVLDEDTSLCLDLLLLLQLLLVVRDGLAQHLHRESAAGPVVEDEEDASKRAAPERLDDREVVDRGAQRRVLSKLRRVVVHLRLKRHQRHELFKGRQLLVPTSSLAQTEGPNRLQVHAASASRGR